MMGSDIPILVLAGATASGDTFTDPGANPGVGAPQDLRSFLCGLATLNVTAASGTSPTLTVDLMTQDASGDWVRFDGFAQATAAGVSTLAIGPGALPNTLAVRYTIGGTTPSFAANVVLSLKS